MIALENDENAPIAFMGIDNGKLEMLFVKNSERRKGLGKQLLSYGMENYDINELTVNEQNYSARNFYEHMRFKVYKRSELDKQGNYFPILYMKLKK